MKKSLIALAVASAFAAPAFAATGNIDISGKIAADLTFVNGVTDTNHTNSAATTGNTYSVNNNNSVITISGKEDLGGGISAMFSLTYGLPLASGGTLSGQNQIAGLTGGFGTVFMGAFDNPLKVIGRGTDLFADQSNGDARHLTSVGHVEARANDVLAYISPNMSGFQFVLAHTNNPLTAGAISSSAAPDTSMWIGKVAYSNGPLSLAAAYHTIDLNPAANDENAWRVTGSYSIGDLKLVASYQDVNNGISVTGFGTAGLAINYANKDFQVWGVGAAYAMGPITLKGQYYSLSDDTTAQADANMWAVGMDYSLSKRTTVQLAYSKITNDANASYGANNVVAGSDKLNVTAGKDPSRFSVGLKHTF